MGLHFAFLAFVVFGGFLAWRWPGAGLPHLAAAGWGLLVVAASLECPLTYLEDHLRRQAGQPGLPAGFIDTYLAGVLYPEQYSGSVQLAVLVLVLTSWIGGYRRWRRTRTTPTWRPRVPPVTQ
jgi:hypothetical protein